MSTAPPRAPTAPGRWRRGRRAWWSTLPRFRAAQASIHADRCRLVRAGDVEALAVEHRRVRREGELNASGDASGCDVHEPDVCVRHHEQPVRRHEKAAWRALLARAITNEGFPEELTGARIERAYVGELQEQEWRRGRFHRLIISGTDSRETPFWPSTSRDRQDLGTDACVDVARSGLPGTGAVAVGTVVADRIQPGTSNPLRWSHWSCCRCWSWPRGAGKVPSCQPWFRPVHCRRGMDPSWNPWPSRRPSPAPFLVEPSTPALRPG
jgi:hypothetical protein